MFSKPIKSTKQRHLVRVVSADGALGQRVRALLQATDRFHVETIARPLLEAEDVLRRSAPVSMLVIELDHQNPHQLATLEDLLRAQTTAPAVIVVSDGIGESAARRFLKLQISDWLPKHCSDRELVQACEQAVTPASWSSGQKHAKCITFLPAVGGAGTTTLSLASVSALTGKGRSPPASTCVVDLNFQAGAVSDYLDLTPNLQLAEITAAPERLDGHLLEVMLSRHRSGFAVLAAPPSLTGLDTMRPETVGRLLDLACVKFENVVIDMPRGWLPSCEDVVRGTDQLFIVTEMTVAGLRQACRLADMVAQSLGVATQGTVIVNKCPWLARGGVKKAHARELLGERLAGFVRDCSPLVRNAQNRGVLLSDLKRSNVVETDLRSILTSQRARTKEAAVAKVKPSRKEV